MRRLMVGAWLPFVISMPAGEDRPGGKDTIQRLILFLFFCKSPRGAGNCLKCMAMITRLRTVHAFATMCMLWTLPRPTFSLYGSWIHLDFMFTTSVPAGVIRCERCGGQSRRLRARRSGSTKAQDDAAILRSCAPARKN